MTPETMKSALLEVRERIVFLRSTTFDAVCKYVADQALTTLNSVLQSMEPVQSKDDAFKAAAMAYAFASGGSMTVDLKAMEYAIKEYERIKSYITIYESAKTGVEVL